MTTILHSKELFARSFLKFFLNSSESATMAKAKAGDSLITVDESEVEAWAVKIGRTIAAARNAKKLNQTGLGQSIGVSRVTISKIENGDTGIGWGTMLAAMCVVATDPFTLFGGKASTKSVPVKHQVLHDLVDEIIASKDPDSLDATRLLLRRMVK